MDIPDLPAAVIADLVRKREISAMEVVDATLERIASVDGRPGALEHGEESTADREKVHAFITLMDQRARARAAAVDRAVGSGEDPGLLSGVPITIKDIYCVQDTPSTAGSRILANFVAPYTATAAARLEQNGAVILGKVNLDEFAYGSSCESSAFQPTPRNPWNLACVPGGSSGGSAAAVAAGEGAISLGTDTAGSIRQPAAFCGVVGLKPTYGRVSRYGLIAFGSSLDCPGPLARNVTDAALGLQAMAGPDPKDATAASVAVPDYLNGLEDGIRGLRIGLSPDYFRITFFDSEKGRFHQEPLPQPLKDAVLDAAERLADLGAEIVEDIPMASTRHAVPAYFVISRVEAASNLHRFDGVKYGYRTPEPVNGLQDMYRKTRSQGFGPQPKLRILMGMYVSAAQYSEQYYSRALRIRSLMRSEFEGVFDPQGDFRLDALLTPTTPTTAFQFGEVYGNSVLMQYADQLTVPANHAGIPGLSIPAGFDQDNRPIGIQLLGPDFMESTLLRIGRAYEIATQEEPWRSRRPAVLETGSG